MKKEVTQLVTAATLPDELTQKILTEFTPHAENVTALLADIEALGQDIEEEGGEINQAHADYAKKLLKRLTAIKGAADRSRKSCGAPYHDTWKACNKVGNLFRDGLEKQKPNIERIAHHFILEEQRKRAKLAEERIAKMSPYKANAHTLDLELMDDDAFEMMLMGAKALHAQRKAEAEAAHAADEAARKAKREAEIADAAARLVAERDAAAAASSANTRTCNGSIPTENAPTLTDNELREIEKSLTKEMQVVYVERLPTGECVAVLGLGDYEDDSEHVGVFIAKNSKTKERLPARDCRMLSSLLIGAHINLYVPRGNNSGKFIRVIELVKCISAPANTGVFSGSAPVANIATLTDNAPHENAPDTGAVMLVSDAVKLIKEGYFIGFDNGVGEDNQTPYWLVDKIEDAKNKGCDTHIGTIKHPAIVGYMQQGNGLPTPLGTIMPAKEK